MEAPEKPSEGWPPDEDLEAEADQAPKNKSDRNADLLVKCLKVSTILREY
jgi:hypothetical protein